MKLIKRTKKLELDLNVELGSVILSTASRSKGKLWNHLSNSMLQKGGTEIITSYNYPLYNSRTKIASSHFLSCLAQLFVRCLYIKFQFQEITDHFCTFSRPTEWNIKGHFLIIYIFFFKRKPFAWPSIFLT